LSVKYVSKYNSVSFLEFAFETASFILKMNSKLNKKGINELYAKLRIDLKNDDYLNWHQFSV